jgi:hypothetical protein
MRLAVWLWPAALLPVGGLVIALPWLTSDLTGRGPAVSGGPIVQITAPTSGFKLRQGRTMAVRVRVQPGTRPLAGWTLQLLDSQSKTTELASGTEAVDNRDVAQVAAADLVAGETYTLVLQAADTARARETGQIDFLIPDPQYTLIPLEPGNNSRPMWSGFSMDANGRLVVMGGYRFGDVIIIDTATNTARTLHLDLQNSDAIRLSGDGQRLIFGGGYGTGWTLALVDLATDAITDGPATRFAGLFSTDFMGQRIAYKSGGDLNGLQYFLYDDSTKTTRQLTQGLNVLTDRCSNEVEVSADGTTVAFATVATLGLVPEDPNVGCRVFVYDVATGAMRQALALPNTNGLSSTDRGYISADGAWFSFSFTRVVPPGILIALPTLLDLSTGEFSEPLGGITEYPSFDSAVSPDGTTVVISTQADMDPRVGNADHNMDLLAYDRASGRFTQIGETTGGLAGSFGTCDAYKPTMSADAGVVGFDCVAAAEAPCHIEAPQRNEADGFVFHRVRAVRKRPGNRPPVLQPVGAIRVQAGQTLSLDSSASDPDGDPIVFFAQLVDGVDVPPGSQIEDHRDGTATLTWPTKPQDLGSYPMRVAAFDEGGGETLQDFTIAVCSKVVNDGTLSGVLDALFDPTAPIACHDADLNRDGAISAADVVRAGAGDLTTR